MDREPQPLTDARFLVARAASTTPPTGAEISAVRGRLAAMRAHPSCDAAAAERISGALLVLDVLALASSGAEVPQALAG